MDFCRSKMVQKEFFRPRFGFSTCAGVYKLENDVPCSLMQWSMPFGHKFSCRKHFVFAFHNPQGIICSGTTNTLYLDVFIE